MSKLLYLNYFSSNAINNVLRHIFSVAMPKGFPLFEVELDLISDQVRVRFDANKEIHFSLINNDQFNLLLEGNTTFTYEKSAYGENIPLINNRNSRFGEIIDNDLIIHADILTIPLVLMTRYEELIKTDRDKLGRFMPEYGIEGKYNLMDIPIVDEYALLLRKYLTFFLPNLHHGVSDFKIVPTHDIDETHRFKNIAFSIASILGGDLINRKSIKYAYESSNNLIRSIHNRANDPYIQGIKQLAAFSDEYSLKSEFYFMSAQKSAYDPGYKITSEVKRLVDSLLNRGHVVGFHPGFYTMTDGDRFLIEKDLLEKSLGTQVFSGRQHYLRFDAHNTWRIWANAGMKFDSTLGYSSQVGFRCGTCHPFQPYDLANDKPYDIIEKPLIAMDITLSLDTNQNLEGKTSLFQQLLTRCKQVEGQFVYLIHNTNIDRDQTKMYESTFANTISTFCNSGK